MCATLNIPEAWKAVVSPEFSRVVSRASSSYSGDWNICFHFWPITAWKLGWVLIFFFFVFGFFFFAIFILCQEYVVPLWCFYLSPPAAQSLWLQLRFECGETTGPTQIVLCMLFCLQFWLLEGWVICCGRAKVWEEKCTSVAGDLWNLVSTGETHKWVCQQCFVPPVQKLCHS